MKKITCMIIMLLFNSQVHSGWRDKFKKIGEKINPIPHGTNIITLGNSHKQKKEREKEAERAKQAFERAHKEYKKSEREYQNLRRQYDQKQRTAQDQKKRLSKIKGQSRTYLVTIRNRVSDLILNYEKEINIISQLVNSIEMNKASYEKEVDSNWSSYYLYSNFSLILLENMQQFILDNQSSFSGEASKNKSKLMLISQLSTTLEKEETQMNNLNPLYVIKKINGHQKNIEQVKNIFVKELANLKKLNTEINNLIKELK